MKRIFFIAICAFMLLTSCEGQSSEVEFNAQEKEEVIDLNKETGGPGILYNAEGENINPKTAISNDF